MYITTKDWKNYIDKLSKLSEAASDAMMDYVRKNGFADTNALIEYAYKVANTYGNGASALSAEMYDLISELSGQFYEPAELADEIPMEDVAKTINGIRKMSNSIEMLAKGIGRLVKRSGADTTLKNAIRDGAEFAWVPNGDTCAFCIALASRGWQPASKAALKKGHAEHIHANCDCTYAIRFDENTNVAGYDPERYREMYYGADGSSPKDRINSIRRMKYEQNKDRINAQKRAVYARKRNIEKGYTDSKSRIGTNEVDMDYIRSQDYRDKFNRLSNDPELNELIYKKAVKILDDNKNTDTETTIVMSKYETIVNKRGEKDALGVSLSPGQIGMIQSKNNKVGLHNHPTNLPPNGSDFTAAGARGYDFGLIVTHDGNLYKYSTGDKPFAAQGLNNLIDKYSSKEYNLTVQEAYDKALQEYKERFGISWQLVE